MLNLYLRFRRPITIVCLLLGILSAAWVLVGTAFPVDDAHIPQLIFAGCICVGAIGLLVSACYGGKGLALLLFAHLISMIGFGMGIGLTAGSTSVIPMIMAALNGALALVVLLVRVEQDDREKSSKL